MIRKLALAVGLIATLVLASCGQDDSKTLNFSILSAEDQLSMAKVWQPLLDDMQKKTGLKVKAFYASNYTSLIEAMRFNQVQMGWFSALPTLEAVRRADGEVVGRILQARGAVPYASVLLVRKGSGITLDDMLKCGKRYNFGIGDARSTSGTLAPMAYIFIPHDIDPSACFKVVRSSSHQANLFGVANGVVDIGTNNTVGLVFAKRQNPDIASRVQVIWTSPPLPESSIVVRKDMDPAVKAKIQRFFLTYGSAPGPEGDHERAVLKALTYGGFGPVDPGYLDPVLRMDAGETLYEAKKTGDPQKIAAAQSAYDAAMAQIASHQASAAK
ncbi:MAG TPA: phosphate/phosphite/phosphonate ABC transporter substrate-binding protein [Caulobacteraceae bacterium]|jgi:phosphonate transport system substrate-binding protein|nr:phosphate/phosphite/phosphonate ABC transporter substrate-binding protein [Caulobacteraceae bacterium]